MSTPIPRSYAPLIGRIVRDAKVVTHDGRERLVLEYADGSQYEVTGTADGGIEVVESAASAPEDADRGDGPTGREPNGLQHEVVDFARDLWRSFSDGSSSR